MPGEDTVEQSQPSLIRQRQDIRGQKSAAVVGVVLFSGWMLFFAARLVWFSGDTTSLWLLIGWGACGIALLIFNSLRLRKVLMRERAFEAEHGKDAGRQQPLSRRRGAR